MVVSRQDRERPVVRRAHLLDALDRSTQLVILCAPPGFDARELVGAWIAHPGSGRTLLDEASWDGADGDVPWSSLTSDPAGPGARERLVEWLYAIDAPVIVLELDADAGQSIRAASELCALVPHLRVLALTACMDDEAARAAQLSPQASVFDASHLALTTSEIHELVRARVPAAPDDVARVVAERFAGWPALVEAWLLSASDVALRDTLATGTSIDAFADATVADPSWPAAMAGEVAAAAVPAELTACSARALGIGLETLRELAGRSLVACHGTAPDRTYRLCPAIRGAVARTPAGREARRHWTPRLVMRAIDDGEYSDAIEFAVAEARWSLAAATASRYVLELMLSHRRSTLAALQRIPAGTLARYPRIGWLTELCGGPSAGDHPVPELLRRRTDAGQLSRVPSPDAMLTDGYAALALLTQRGDMHGARTLRASLEALVTTHVESGDGAHLTGPMRCIEALHLLAGDDGAGAERVLRPVDLRRSTGAERLVHLGLAAVAALQGQTRRASELLEQAEAIDPERATARLQSGLAAVTSAFLAFDRLDAHQASAHLVHVDLEGQAAFVQHAALYLRARLAPEGPADDELDAELARAAATFSRRLDGAPRVPPILSAALIERAAQAGDVGTALQDAAAHEPGFLNRLALLRAKVAGGRFDRAVDLARIADDQATPPRVRIEALLLAEAAHHGLGQHEAATAAADSAEQTAGDLGMLVSRRLVVVPFADRRAPAPRVGSVRLRGAVPPAPLSRTELEVLHDMEEGLTLQQIAAKRYVSRNTVKTQARSIYHKLDVQTREQALAAAMRWSLLSRQGPAR